MASILTTGAVTTFQLKLANFKNANFAPLMQRWEQVIVDDNSRGVLAGIGSDDHPLAKVTYRPVDVSPRMGARSRLRKYSSSGTPPGSNNNLTSAQYRTMSGPPLAPQASYSRVITNLFTGSTTSAVDGVWWATGAWKDVVSRNGDAFLKYHFTGEGQLQRDLRGVRAQGRADAQKLLSEFLDTLWNQG